MLQITDILQSIYMDNFGTRAIVGGSQRKNRDDTQRGKNERYDFSDNIHPSFTFLHYNLAFLIIKISSMEHNDLLSCFSLWKMSGAALCRPKCKYIRKHQHRSWCNQYSFFTQLTHRPNCVLKLLGSRQNIDSIQLVSSYQDCKLTHLW